jgi:hypothetical protein
MITKSKGQGTTKYQCDACGESWVGVTNRVADRPLNEKAVACADSESYASCPRLTDEAGQTRPITFSSGDYLCRRKWMDAYLTCLQEPPVVPPPPKACDPVVGCPPGPVVPAAVKCALIEISGECAHHGEEGARVAREDLTLEVVPSSYGSDKIELRANVQKACGAHPSWTISENGTQTGQKASFKASGPVVQKFLLWLPSISPREYAVTCSTCNGSASLQVHAYPPNEFAFNLDAKKGVIKVIKKILHVAEKVLDAISGKFEWKWLEGKLNAEASWKEYKDYRAYYGYKLDVNLTPLIGGEFVFVLDGLKIMNIVSKIPGH